jgi:3',5'-cyclic AMP phosphodiesterase CpdA
MITFVHISDLHFGDACADKLSAASRTIAAIGPDCVILTGDLTQEGKREEFTQAADWFKTIEAPIVGCPGNHDMPMFNLALRLADPFGRFRRLGLLSNWQSRDGLVHIEAANSARGLQWRLDWSQGDYGQPDVLAALDRLGHSNARHKILALHHPPETPIGAAVTSEPSGLDVFTRHLLGDRPDLLLCGHVHAAFDFPARALEGMRVMTAPSLASSRERGFGSGLGVIRLSPEGPLITRRIWRLESGFFRESSEAYEGTLHIAS